MTKVNIVSITMTSGMDILAELIESKDDALTVKNPQMYIPTTNQFVPFIMTAKIQDRVVDIPHHAIVLACEPLDAFVHAYTDMFIQPEVEESDEPTSAIAQNMKAQNDIMEAASPVHGGKTTESGIILA